MRTASSRAQQPSHPPAHHSAWPQPIRGTRRRASRRRGLTIAAAALALVGTGAGLDLVALSDSAFTSRTANGGNNLGAADYFTCAAAIAADNPPVWYRLDDTRTTAVNSGQGDDGTYQGTTTKSQTRACVRDTGTAVAFNGSSGYISLATRYSVPTTYTVEAWVKTTTTSGGLVAGAGASATGASANVDRVLYMTSNGRLAFGNTTGSASTKTAITSTARYNDGDWHHVMATLGPSGMNLYVDAARVATSTTTDTASYSGYFRVAYDNLSGWPNAPSSSYFRGTLDDVAAYTTTLTAADVAAHYEAGT